MRRPEAILFDLWGTLLHSNRFDPAAGNEAVLSHCDNPRGVSLAEIQALGNRVISEVEPREDQVAIEFTEASLLRLLMDSFGLVARQPLPELEWIFWRASSDVRLMDGVPRMLSLLRQRGTGCGVVSNSSFSSETLSRELERQGIRERFQIVVSSADYGVRKPDPLIFETALRRMGAEAASTWFIGDHLGYDIQGASRAGLLPVAYNPQERVPPGGGEVALITHWDQLIGMVEAACDPVHR